MWVKSTFLVAVFLTTIASGQSFILEPAVGIQHVYPGPEVSSKPGSGFTGGFNFVWQPIRIGIEASAALTPRLVDGSPKLFYQSGAGLSWQFWKQDESLYFQAGVANSVQFSSLYIGLRWRHPYFSAGIKLETDIYGFYGQQNAVSMTLGVPFFINYN